MRTLLLVTLTFAVVLFGSYLEGAHASVLWQKSAFIVVFGPLAIYLLLTLGVSESIRFLRRISDRATTTKDHELLSKLSSLGFLFGGVYFAIGMIHVLQNLTNMASIGNGLAVAFVGILYGHVPAVFSTLINRLPKVPVTSGNSSRE